MARILYVRHGQTSSNAQDIFSGAKDPALLTQQGMDQVQAAGVTLREMNVQIDRVIASPLERVKQTAAAICTEIGFDFSRVEYDSRLVEYDMGEMTLQPRAGVTAAQLVSASGAEDPHYFMDRVVSVLTELDDLEGTVLMVAHAGVRMVIQCWKEGIDPARFYELKPHHNAQVSEL